MYDFVLITFCSSSPTPQCHDTSSLLPNSGTPDRTNLGHHRARVPSIPELQEVITYGGSVRMRISSLENLQQMQSQQLASVHSARAVENIYHFV